MIGVGFDISWKDELFDLPDMYLAAEICVLMHKAKAMSHFDKILSSLKKPSQPRLTGPPPTLRNAPLTDISVDFMVDLYSSDVFVILRPTEKAITEGVVCVLVMPPVARVIGRLR